MKQSLPVIIGIRSALQLPNLFETLGHSDLIIELSDWACGGVHKDGYGGGLTQCALACRQVEDAWKLWKAETSSGRRNLVDFITDYAKAHSELLAEFANNA